MKPIFLTGFMGSGKSTIGRRLAQKIEREFHDLDARIEEACGKTVAQIFSGDGEEKFRELESEMLAELEKDENSVISLGGGALLSSANQALVSKGTLIYLKAPLETLVSRIEAQGRTRPLFSKTSLVELFEARRSGYESAEIHVETHLKTPSDVVSELLSMLEEKR